MALHEYTIFIIAMFKNYFKITFRGLWKNKTYNLLNILGLAIGLTCAAVIFLWVEDELTFNNSHEKKDRVYQVMENWQYDDGIRTFSSTPAPLAASMKSDLPGIRQTCRATEQQINSLFTIGDKTLYAAGIYADASLFNIFTFPFVEGSAGNAFRQLYSMVITEKTARKFFGSAAQAIGKTITVDNAQPYVISGVIKDIPENSSLQFDWVAPFEIYFHQHPYLAGWDANSVSTYAELDEKADLGSINKELQHYIQQHAGPDAINHTFLLGMNDWRLHSRFENGRQSGGRIEYVRLFSLIAWIILFIACINFMNLSTARSEKRAKEVGIRKVMGAGKGRLVIQFISEALFMSLLAAVVAVLLLCLVLPAFNALVDKHLTVGLGNPLHILWLLMIALICGIVAGSYPSLYLSSFNPVTVLKSMKLKTGSAAAIRKGLVVAQFSTSIILIICTVIIYQQIQHTKDRNLGFNKDYLISINVQGNMVQNFPAIKTALLASGAVQNAALADHTTIYGGNNTNSIDWAGKPASDKILISQRLVSPEFISTSGMQLTAGSDFKPVAASNGMDVLVTQSLEKLMGPGSAVGKILLTPHGDSVIHSRIIGVVKDYVYGNIYGTPDPVVFYCIPEEARLLYVRMNRHAGMETSLQKIGEVMKQYNPAYPFTYRFVDDQFNAMFSNETLIQQLSRLFAALAIVISCLGLFGLAAYTAERRTKEIGIRKVLGASVAGITGLLSADFLKLVGLSALIAFPVAWYTMEQWLQKYPYRIAIHFSVFIFAAMAAMVIALLTISFQSVKAAMMNPVKSLKAE